MTMLRPATALDAGKIGAILSGFVEEFQWMPRLHSRAEDVAHAGDLIARGWVTVAQEADGFIARDGGVIHSLYIRHEQRGYGLGSALLKDAQNRSDTLRLWTFQANMPAQVFYKKHGFHEVARTDGRSNDERLPDIEYIWEKP